MVRGLLLATFTDMFGRSPSVCERPVRTKSSHNKFPSEWNPVRTKVEKCDNYHKSCV